MFGDEFIVLKLGLYVISKYGDNVEEAFKKSIDKVLENLRIEN
ncbi:MAG: hypothetical protein ACFE9Q_15315 [Candidatus Hodarchaeota archaeon]